VSAVVVRAEDLQSFGAALIERAGAPQDIAAEVAGHLVGANLAGHDSHGVVRLTQYLGQAERGELLPDARPELLSEAPGGALVDAKRGFGPYSTAFAMDWAIERAAEQGIAAVAIRHSMHVGRLGHYTETAASAGVIGIVTAGAVGAEVGGMGLPGARGRFFSTNPWSFGFPGVERRSVFDGATSAVAEGKVRLARAAGQTLPPGCVVDKEGNPTQDPEEFYAGGALLPLGGELAGHKGYGLALASALLGGLSAMGDSDPTVLGAQIAGEGSPVGRLAGVFVLVVDPGLFGARRAYHELVDDALGAIESAPPQVGGRGPMVPGQPEASARAHREREGVPVAEAAWADLGELARRYAVAPPPTVA
jgi:uncharacterized oxidoreductase